MADCYIGRRSVVVTKALITIFSYTSYLDQRKKAPFDISYKSFMNYCLKAKQYPGKFSTNFLLLLEHRIDFSLHRIKFCETIAQARQMINHQKILINGNPCESPSYHMKPGDIVEVVQNDHFDFLSASFSLAENGKKNSKKGKPFLVKRVKQKNLFQKKRPIFLSRPLNWEVNYALATAIFLYSPQKVYFKQFINVDHIRRSFKRTI